MTTPSASPAEPAEPPPRRMPRAGRGLFFWYQAVRLARASAACSYRMGHFTELLGGATTLVDRRPPTDAFRGARAVVAVRPYVDEAARTLLIRAGRAGALRIADFDDLLFAGDAADSPLVVSGALGTDRSAARMAHYRAGLDAFDAFTVSTEPLREELLATLPGARVVHVPNGLSPSWVRQGRALHRPWQPGDPRVIRYLSGSPHDADFAILEPVLIELLRARPELSLELVGAITRPRRLPPERVRVLPRVPYVELPRLLASSWVTLAPLAPSRFNGCKSAIKFLESAAFEAPCIATPIADMRRHEEGGVMLAQDEGQWYRAFLRLLDDDYRMTIGRRGRAWVDRHGHADVGARAIRALVEEGRAR